MPHPIVEISELTQLVADHLLHDSRQSLVSLACTCRALEEQALSTLWSEQPSLRTLIRSGLPTGIPSSFVVLSHFTTAEWDKFRRYASWMRCLDLTEDASVTEEILHIISANSPNRIMCPQLRNLSWVVQPHTLPFYRLFLSPHLTTFSLKYRSHWGEIPDEVLSGITSVVLELDNLSLRHLYLTIPARISPSLDSAVSSAVLRCGPSLESLSAPTPLSDAAVQHVMRLPNLTTWEGVNGPAGVSDLSLSGAFPELKALQLQAEASLEWLPLFWAAARHTSSGQDSRAPFNHAPGQKLTVLECWADVSVDAAFMSPIMLFHGLIELMLESTCPSVGGCTFSLTDDDVAEIATALPRLRIALFGRPCSANSCRTTVSSLVFLSTHCKSLELLELHFNTTNLRDELESVSVDPRPNDLPSSPGRFFSLCMADAPYSMRDEDVVPMLTGFFRIFPSLGGIQGNGSGWYRLSPRFNPQVRSTLFSALHVTPQGQCRALEANESG